MSTKHTCLQILKGKRTPPPRHHSLLDFLFGFILELMKDARLMALETETLYLAAKQAGRGKSPHVLLLWCFCSKPRPDGSAVPGTLTPWLSASAAVTMPLGRHRLCHQPLLLLCGSGFSPRRSKYFRTVPLDAAALSFFAATVVVGNWFKR